MKLSLKIKKMLGLFTVLGLAALPLFAGAQIGGGGWHPLREQQASGLSGEYVYVIIKTIMMWLLLILTVVAVIGFIISGFMFIVGDTSDNKEKAKNWLTYSIIGVVVALIGYIVINLIDSLLLGVVQQ